MAKKVSFEEKLAALENIVEELEEGTLSLEDAVSHYQKGVKLHREAQSMLQAMEKKIEAVTSRGEEVSLPSTGDEE